MEVAELIIHIKILIVIRQIRYQAFTSYASPLLSTFSIFWSTSIQRKRVKRAR